MIPEIILDTDIGSDCDDVGAMAVLHALAARGKCGIAAIVSSTSRRDGPAIIDAINRFYGRRVPIGQLRSKQLAHGTPHGMYARAVSWVYENDYRDRDAEDACRLLRRTLAAAKNPLRLVTIGTFANIADLLASQPDDLSPLDGRALVAEKVLDMYSMAGMFRVPENYGGWWAEAECNVVQSLGDSRAVVRDFPRPIVFSPFELGCRILTGKRLLEGKDSPVKMGYYVHGGAPRESWDPLTVWAAVEGLAPFRAVTGVTVEIDERGVTTFRAGGKDTVLADFASEEARDKLAETLEALIAEGGEA